MRKTVIIYTGIALGSVSAFAQPAGQVNNLGNEDITIVKDYQPVLNDAFKINILPHGDTSTATPSPLKYEAEPVQMNAAFNITPIKPVKIKDDNIKKLYRGFIKAGYGNYNTPLAELYFNSVRSKQFDAGVHARHLSSSGKIKGYGHPNYSENKIGVNATRFFDNNALTGELSFNRDVFHFYGYESPPELFTKSETRHVMNLFGGTFGFNSTHINKDRLSYKATVHANGYSDNRNSDESLIDVSAEAGKRFNDSYISADMEFAAMHLTQPMYDNNHTIFKTGPRYSFKKEQFHITAGANIAFESGDFIDSKLHLYPHARMQFQLLSDQVTIHAQVSGDLKKNTLVGFSRENKFLDDFTWLKNTNEKFSLSGGIDAKLSRELIVTMGASVTDIENQPYFYNLPAIEDPVKYGVLYDNANLLNFNIAIDFAQAEKTGFGMRLDYNSYNNDSLRKQLFIPAFRVGVYGRHAIAEKIYIKSELYFNDGAYAISYEPLRTDYLKLKSYIDVNFGIDYKYSKILSAFVQVNNLGMQKYFRWYNYPSYRLNAMAGITYSFLRFSALISAAVLPDKLSGCVEIETD